jgi:hypothetical protein
MPVLISFRLTRKRLLICNNTLPRRSIKLVRGGLPVAINIEFVIGYGYHVWQAVLWLGILLIAGAGVQWTRPSAKGNNVGQLMLYSFEMLLPIFSIAWSDKGISIPAARRVVSHTGSFRSCSHCVSSHWISGFDEINVRRAGMAPAPMRPRGGRTALAG